MVFLGVPVFDWVLLLVLLGFGVEAYLTCRTPDDDQAESPRTGESVETQPVQTLYEARRLRSTRSDDLRETGPGAPDHRK